MLPGSLPTGVDSTTRAAGVQTVPATPHTATLIELVRASAWWEYKLSPLAAMIYATGHLMGVSMLSLWPALALSLVAMIPAAAYVGLINDLADLDDDRASGKSNRAVNASALRVAAVLVVALGAGGAMVAVWRTDPLLVGCYIAVWVAFSLYSLPPIRLKRHGVFGILADASGSHLFPALTVVVLSFRVAGVAIDPVWVALVGVWALACGLRGILWHQIDDRHNDARAGVSTFAVRHDPQAVERAVVRGLFPVELAALGALILCLGSAAPVVALAAYAVVAALRHRLWHEAITVVRPRPGAGLVLHEYYEAFLPATLLAVSVFTSPSDLLMLGAHLVMFPRRPGHALKDVLRMIGRRKAVGMSTTGVAGGAVAHIPPRRSA